MLFELRAGDNLRWVVISWSWHSDLPHFELLIIICLQGVTAIEIELHELWINGHSLLTSDDKVWP